MLGRFDPFREIEDAWTKMGNLLGDVVTVAPEGRTFGALASMVTPVDIEETNDAYIVEFDLPGARREDVSIDLHDGELVVSGEIKERERSGKLRRQARRSGSFDYRVGLPGEVDTESVKASLRDGVLTITCARQRATHPRHIEIESS
jgi:HSP20 family protein